jgi:hypothetical protein
MLSHVADALRTIIRDEGWTALYRGLLPGILLTSNGAIQFVVYEWMKKRFRSPHEGFQPQVELLVFFLRTPTLLTGCRRIR